MPRLDDIAQAFYTWEEKHRGWEIYSYPIELEQPLVPISVYLSETRRGPTVDDGRQHTLLSGLASGLGEIFKPKDNEKPDHQPEPDLEYDDEPRHFTLLDDMLKCFQIALPKDYTGHLEIYRNFLQSLRYAKAHLSFEVIGSADQIVVQCCAWPDDADKLLDQIRSHFPQATVLEMPDVIEGDTFSDQTLVVDFGLEHEALYALNRLSHLKHDPLTALVGGMEALNDGEQCIFQILFKHANEPWGQYLRNVLLDTESKPLFTDTATLIKQAHEKTNSPLYFCVIRLCVIAPDEQRRWALAREVGGALAQYDAPALNNLMPLDNEGYDAYDHWRDVVERTTHRSSMLLSLDELVGFLHYPDEIVKSEKLLRQRMKTKAAPEFTLNNELHLGVNEHRGEQRDVSLSNIHRARHLYLVGASGTGKSTALLNMIIQDMQAGKGIGVLDPHGDLIDTLLGYIPDERIQDVIVFDPSDEEYPIGFNIIDAHSELEKTLLASDLVSVFKRLSTSWGDQMNSVLANGISAMLESTEGGTLPILRRFLVDKTFRQEFLTTVQDPENVFYWEREFPLLSGKPQGPVLTRLDTFLRPKPIRYMVAQQDNKIDFAKIMQGKKIFLAKLSQGAIGTENSYLMGAFLVTKLNQIAFSRQALAESQRQDFYLYIDEFHNFITPSMESILSGARKYHMALILAHQELRQLEGKDADVAASVISNPYTRICFRLGDSDAKRLQQGFSHFDAQDLQSLGIGEAIARVERAEYDFNLKTPPLPDFDQQLAQDKARAIIRMSQQKYGLPKAEVETLLNISLGKQAKPVPQSDQSLAKSESNSNEPITNKVGKSSGRGGDRHKQIQHEIKAIAEKHGFKATIEKRINDGKGHVDVALEQGDITIAFEVAVNSTIEQERNNIEKCLKAGFDQVVSVVVDSEFDKKLEQTINENFDEYVSQAQVMSAGQITEFFSQYKADPTKRLHGYEVEVDVADTKSQGNTQKQKVAEKATVLIAQSFIQKPREKSQK